MQVTYKTVREQANELPENVPNKIGNAKKLGTLQPYLYRDLYTVCLVHANRHYSERCTVKERRENE